GVGEDLLVARHRGVEHDLANGLASGPERVALVDGPVLEGEDRVWLGEERHPSANSTTRSGGRLHVAYMSLHVHAARPRANLIVGPGSVPSPGGGHGNEQER